MTKTTGSKGLSVLVIRKHDILFTNACKMKGFLLSYII